jgi:hypothetical protein
MVAWRNLAPPDLGSRPSWRRFTPGSTARAASTATPDSRCPTRPGRGPIARHALAGDGRRVREVGRGTPAYSSAPSGRHCRRIGRIRENARLWGEGLKGSLRIAAKHLRFYNRIPRRLLCGDAVPPLTFRGRLIRAAGATRYCSLSPGPPAAPPGVEPSKTDPIP